MVLGLRQARAAVLCLLFKHLMLAELIRQQQEWQIVLFNVLVVGVQVVEQMQHRLRHLAQVEVAALADILSLM